MNHLDKRGNVESEGLPITSSDNIRSTKQVI